MSDKILANLIGYLYFNLALILCLPFIALYVWAVIWVGSL